VRDDCASAGYDGRRDDVFVIRVGKSVGSLQGLPPLDLGVVEVAAHLLDQMARPPVGLALRLTSTDQLVGLVILQLLQATSTARS